jgi:hypothetical protein
LSEVGGRDAPSRPRGTLGDHQKFNEIPALRKILGLIIQVSVRKTDSRLATSIEGYVKAPHEEPSEIDHLQWRSEIRQRSSMARPLCEVRSMSGGRDLSRAAAILIAIAVRLERGEEEHDEPDTRLRESLD